MDNIIIVREAALTSQSIRVGDSDEADMTRAEFLGAVHAANVSFNEGQRTEDGKDAFIWPHF